jgi:hypothetical protein
MLGAEQLRFVESAIRNQRQLGRLHLGLALGVIALGVVLFLVAQWFGAGLIPDNVKQLVALGGGFFATLSSFPIKQLFDRREKIAALEFLFAGLSKVEKGVYVSVEQKASLQERFDRMWDLGLAA